MSLGEIVVGFFQALVPPPDASPGEHYGWRVRVGVTLFVTVIGLTLLAAYAFGIIPGAEGFAHEQEVTSVVGEIRKNRADEIDSQILNLREKDCHATTDEARQLYFGKLNDLMITYQRLTGGVYNLPACSEL